MSGLSATGAITSGHLLGGRLTHDQAMKGHRTGIEPVILAATVPARPGDRVLEAGTGSGAALMCVAHRVSPLSGVGIERDAPSAEIARRNLAANGFEDLRIAETALESFRVEMPFDHAFANPPWHDERGTPSPDPGQEVARRADDGLIARWIACLAASLRPRGTLSLIVASAALPASLAAVAASGCGSPAIFPLWPRVGRPAKLVVLRMIREGRAPCRMLAGLVLHGDGQGYTHETERVLRDGAAIEF